MHLCCPDAEELSRIRVTAEIGAIKRRQAGEGIFPGVSLIGDELLQDGGEVACGFIRLVGQCREGGWCVFEALRGEKCADFDVGVDAGFEFAEHLEYVIELLLCSALETKLSTIPSTGGSVMELLEMRGPDVRPEVISRSRMVRKKGEASAS